MRVIHCPKPPAVRDLVITRVLPARPERVWAMWTQPQHLAQWWGLHDFTNPVSELDGRVGGSYRIVMRGPDGAEFPLTGSYREVTDGERMVMTFHATGSSEAWDGCADLEASLAILLEPLANQTRLTLRLYLPSDATGNALRLIGRPESWAESLEALTAYLVRGGV